MAKIDELNNVGSQEILNKNEGELLTQIKNDPSKAPRVVVVRTQGQTSRMSTSSTEMETADMAHSLL